MTDETGTTEEQFDRMWERGIPVVTTTADTFRDRMITVVAQTIWEHGFKRAGTAAALLDVGSDSLAAAIVNRFTCTECGFIDVGLGNTYGECNDCAPRLSARNRQAPELP